MQMQLQQTADYYIEPLKATRESQETHAAKGERALFSLRVFSRARVPALVRR